MNDNVFTINGEPLFFVNVSRTTSLRQALIVEMYLRGEASRIWENMEDYEMRHGRLILNERKNS